MRARPWIACSVFLLACSSSESPPPTTSPATAATTPPASTDPPAPITCTSGSYRTGQNTCEKFPALAVQRSAVTVAPVRDHHTTIVAETAAGPYLYVFGGTDDWKTLHNDVQRARIHDDGTLDPFEMAGTLPAPRAGHCTVKIKDRYFLGGGVVQATGSDGVSATTLLASLGPDGKLGATTPGPALPQGVMHLTCEVLGDYLYVLGGAGGTNQSSTTMSARSKIAADGSLGAFEAQTPLKPDRSHHASFIRDNKVYIIGGLTGAPAGDYVDRSDCIMADIGADGKLGAWQAAGKLPESLSVSSSQLYEDAVYVFGGLEDDAAFSDKIRRVTFNVDGTLGTFATLPGTLPAPRGHVHETPIWKNFIFSVGGKDNDQNSLGTVDVGQFK